jgi:hypothetical protein
LTGRPPIFRKIITCEQRNSGEGEILFYLLCKLKAIHPAQTHIHKDEIRRWLLDSLQGLFAASCLLNDYGRKTFMKNPSECVPKGRIVLNDECSQHKFSSIPKPASRPSYE